MQDRGKKTPRQVRKDSLGQSLCGFLSVGGLCLIFYGVFGFDRRGKEAVLRQRAFSQSAVASDSLFLGSAGGSPPKPEPPKEQLQETQGNLQEVQENQQPAVEKFTKNTPAYVKGDKNSNECKQGAIEIETVEECEGAASILGLAFNAYDPVRELDPKGCNYRVPDNDVYYNSHDTGSGHPDRKRICREAGTPPASSPYDLPATTSVAAESVPAQAASASTGTTVAAVAPSAAPATKQASYVMTEAGETECPTGSGALEDSDSCQSAADVLGKKFMADDPKSENDPRGCQFRVPDDDVYFNSHDVGKAHTQRQVVCREGAPSLPSAPKVQATGTLTSGLGRKYVLGEADTVDCPPGSKPVENEEACRAAAEGLGKPYYSADFTSEQDPKGCQLRVPDKDVYFNAHEEGSAHSFREPICYEEGESSKPLGETAKPPQPRGEPATPQASVATKPGGQYVLGEADTLDCPPGSNFLENQEACKAAAESLGKKIQEATAVAELDPKGCVFRIPDDDVYFNTHETGSANSARQTICRE